MKVIKVMGNNVVYASKYGKEVVCTGKGIGFGLKRGDLVPKSKIEKTFELLDSKTSNYIKKLLDEIPSEYWEVTFEIEELIEEKINQKVNLSFYVSMLDHVYMAVKRANKGMVIPSGFMLNLRCFYKKEFELAKEIVELMEERFKVKFPKEEAAFIVLHLFDAEMEVDSNEMKEVSKLANEILIVVNNEFAIQKDTVCYEKFLNHLRYFLQNIVSGKKSENIKMDIYDTLKEKYKVEQNMIEKICDIVEAQKDYKVTDAEKFYLMLRLLRLTNDDFKED